MIQLNYRDAKPIYEQIKDGLKHLLVSKAIETGEMSGSLRQVWRSTRIRYSVRIRSWKVRGISIPFPEKAHLRRDRMMWLRSARKNCFCSLTV